MEAGDPEIVIEELREELAEAQLQRDEAEGRLEDAELEILELLDQLANCAADNEALEAELEVAER